MSNTASAVDSAFARFVSASSISALSTSESGPRKLDSASTRVPDHRLRKGPPTSPPQVLGKVKDFLGVMAKANEKLEINAQGTSRSDYDIEVLDGNEQEYIEMDLLLGVADLQTPEAVAAAEATIGGFQPSAASTSSSSCSDTEDESDKDDDSDNDSEDQRWRVNKPGDKPNKRPKIVVLN